MNGHINVVDSTNFSHHLLFSLVIGCVGIDM